MRNFLHMPEGSVAEYAASIAGLIGALAIPAIIYVACVAMGFK